MKTTIPMTRMKTAYSSLHPFCKHFAINSSRAARIGRSCVANRKCGCPARRIQTPNTFESGPAVKRLPSSCHDSEGEFIVRVFACQTFFEESQMRSMCPAKSVHRVAEATPMSRSCTAAKRTIASVSATRGYRAMAYVEVPSVNRVRCQNQLAVSCPSVMRNRIRAERVAAKE